MSDVVTAHTYLILRATRNANRAVVSATVRDVRTNKPAVVGRDELVVRLIVHVARDAFAPLDAVVTIEPDQTIPVVVQADDGDAS